MRSLSGPRRLGTLYVWLVILAGGVAVVHACYELWAAPVPYQWFLLAGLTLLSGSITIKVPSVPATISVSETFVFTAVLLFGSDAGTATVALDGLIVSLWLRHRRGHEIYKTLFNVAAPSLAVWLAATLSFQLAGARPLSIDPTPIGRVLVPLFAFTVLYFLLNSWLIAAAIGFESRLSPFMVWRKNFLWLSVNYLGGASLSALLLAYTRDINLTSLGIIVPLLVISYLTFKTSMGRVDDALKHLTALNKLYLSTIETLAIAIDAKDQVTHGHVRRVQTLAVGLARRLGVTDEAIIQAIEAASLLHDMGKLAVPEYILNKPGKLTGGEFEKMKLHASLGADILSSIEFPYPVVPVVRHHHENWDGTGYPDGLKGSEIPIGARILAVADCFDALTSDRPYRPRLSDEAALAVLRDRRGRMYDPLVVDMFLEIVRELEPVELPPSQHGPALVEIARSSKQSSGPVDGAALADEAVAGRDELLAMYTLARSVASCATLREAWVPVADFLRSVLSASAVVLFLPSASYEELIATCAAGDGVAGLEGLRVSIGHGVTGWVAANSQAIVNANPVLDLAPIRGGQATVSSCASVALAIEGRLVGVINAYAMRADSFTERHRRMLERLARLLAHPIRQVIEFEQLQASRTAAGSAKSSGRHPSPPMVH